MNCHDPEKSNNTGAENLWSKYAVSSRELEAQRAETLKVLDGFLYGLGYLKDGPMGEGQP